MDRRLFVAWALMIGSLMGPVGCGTSTPEAMVLEVEPAAELGYTYQWARDLAVPGDERIADVRVLDDLIVVVEEPGNMVTAVALRDGQRRWARVVGDLNQPLYSAFRWGGMIHLNSPIRLFSLHAHDGSVARINDLESTVSTGPVLHGDFAIFGGVDGRVFAHDLNRGFYRWAYQMSDQISTPPVNAGHLVFVTDDRGGYAMLRGDNGELHWRRYTYGPIRAEPVVDERTVYVASEDRSLYALDLRAGGRDRWVHFADRALNQSPGVASDLVLQPLGDAGLVALEKDTGEERWRLARRAEFVLERDDGRLLLAGRDRLMLVHPDTGEVLEQANTHPLETVLRGPDQSIILVSERGRLLRLNPLR